MSYTLLAIGLIILSLSILVTIHELGHFLTAKWFGMRVETFSLFFPPKLFGFTKGETHYQVGAIPLGGYVKISGIIDESMDKEHLDKEPEPWEFRSKPVWQRLIVMVGGVVMNVILGCLIFTGLKLALGDKVIPMENLEYGIDVPVETFVHELGFRTGDKIKTFMGEPVKYFNEIANPGIFLETEGVFEVDRSGKMVIIPIPEDFMRRFTDSLEKGVGNPRIFYLDGQPIINVSDSSGADLGGMKDGDKIVSVDSVPVSRFSAIRDVLMDKKLQNVEVEVEREGKAHSFTVLTDSSGKLGVSLKEEILLDTIHYGLGEAIVKGTQEAFNTIVLNLKGFKKIASGNVDASKSVSGPFKIAAILASGFQSGGWPFFWRLTGLLSMVLALMNILPIPALDGGHVMFLLIEAVTGREPSVKVRMVAQQIGMVILLLLMGFIILNDIYSLF